MFFLGFVLGAVVIALLLKYQQLGAGQGTERPLDKPIGPPVPMEHDDVNEHWTDAPVDPSLYEVRAEKLVHRVNGRKVDAVDFFNEDLDDERKAA